MIKPVKVPILLAFFRHSIMISMAIAMRSISMIIPIAPPNAKKVFPPKSSEQPPKKQRTKSQATRSRRPMEFFKNVFKIFLGEVGWVKLMPCFER